MLNNSQPKQQQEKPGNMNNSNSPHPPSSSPNSNTLLHHHHHRFSNTITNNTNNNNNNNNNPGGPCGTGPHHTSATTTTEGSRGGSDGTATLLGDSSFFSPVATMHPLLGTSASSFSKYTLAPPVNAVATPDEVPVVVVYLPRKPPGLNDSAIGGSVVGHISSSFSSTLLSPESTALMARRPPRKGNESSMVDALMVFEATSTAESSRSVSPSASCFSSSSSRSSANHNASSCPSSSPNLSRSISQTQYKGKWCVNERYVFKNLIGKGGQGSVWKALDLARSDLAQRKKHYVAIKIVKRNKYALEQQQRKKKGLRGPMAGCPEQRPVDEEPTTTQSPRSTSLPVLGCAVGSATRVTRMLRLRPTTTNNTNNNPAVMSPSPTPPRFPHGNTNVATATSTTQAELDLDLSLFSLTANPNANHRDRVKCLRAAYSASSSARSSPAPQSVASSQLHFDGPEKGGEDDDEEEEISSALVAETLVGLIEHENLLGLEEIIDDPKSQHVFLVSRLLEPSPCHIVRGGTTREGCLEPRIVAGYAFDIARALEHLHSNSIVHCDVKLDNLLRDGRQRLVLADFGLARVDAGARPIGGGNGTFAFWAPELFQHPVGTQVHHTPASDCYALGVCLYTMLYGKMPYWTDDFLSRTAWGAKIATAGGGAAAAPRVSEAVLNELDEPNRMAFTLLKSVIRGLMIADPEKRFHARLAARALARFGPAQTHESH